ncbi:MAG: DUF1990 domain-containing protein [Nocardioidaceae bacterium]
MARTVHRLRPDEADVLREQPFSYEPVGATRTGGVLPTGFHHLEEVLDLGAGRRAYEHAVETLMTWRMHTGAGLRVSASADRAGPAEVVRCRLGPLRIPCRVVWVVAGPGAAGFGYGTLPGHPEAGEEAFVVTCSDDRVQLRVTAYSRPGGLATRLAGPAGRWGQRLMVRRYAAALRLPDDTPGDRRGRDRD